MSNGESQALSQPVQLPADVPADRPESAFDSSNDIFIPQLDFPRQSLENPDYGRTFPSNIDTLPTLQTPINGCGDFYAGPGVYRSLANTSRKLETVHLTASQIDTLFKM